MSAQVINTNPNLNLFNFSDNDIRTLIDELGNAWFAAIDVFNSLDIKWSGAGTSLAKVPQKWFTTLKLKTIKGEKDVIFLSEPAVYRVCFRSNKPEAEAFTEWVCEEVLPEIRKTGHFGVPTYNQEIQLRNQLLKIMDLLNSEKDAFKFELLLHEFKKVCRQLGTPVPDLRLLGQDRFQKRLEGID